MWLDFIIEILITHFSIALKLEVCITYIERNLNSCNVTIESRILGSFYARLMQLL
jgi:hypothetical protein